MARIRALKFLNTHLRDSLVDRFQINVARTLESMQPMPLFDSVVLTDVELVAGVENTVFHGLNRPYVGYIVTRATRPVAAGDFYPYESGTSTVDKSQILPLHVNNDVTVDLLVF